MGRYRAAFRTTGAGSSTLPLGSIYSVASIALRLREVWCFNTTATGLTVALHRLTTTGTQGAGITEAKHDPETPAPNATVVDTHTVAPTLGEKLGQAPLAAAAGSGVIWTFDDVEIRIPPGTTSGVGVVPVGTGQICDLTFVWDE